MKNKDKLFSLIDVLDNKSSKLASDKLKEIKSSYQYLFARSLKRRTINDENLLKLRKDVLKIKFRKKDSYLDLMEKFCDLNEKLNDFTKSFGINPFAFNPEESPVEILNVSEIYVQNPNTNKVVRLHNLMTNPNIKRRTKRKYIKFIFNLWIANYNKHIKNKLTEYNMKIGNFNKKKYKKKSNFRRIIIFAMAIFITLIYTNPNTIQSLGIFSFVSTWNNLLAIEWYGLLGLVSIYVLVAYALISIIYNSILSVYIEEGMAATNVLDKFNKLINKEYKKKSKNVYRYYLNKAGNMKYKEYKTKNLPKLAKSFSYLDRFTHTMGTRLKWLNSNYSKMVWMFRFTKLIALSSGWFFIGYGIYSMM